MNKLITELNESIKWKLEDIKKYSKMIDLVCVKDVKGIRKFIFNQETCEKEMFYEMLQWGDAKLFEKVYPNAESQEGKYVAEIIFKQYENDIKELGLMDGDGYPEDYSDFEEDEISKDLERRYQAEKDDEAVKIAEANYLKAVDDLRKVQSPQEHFNKHVL